MTLTRDNGRRRLMTLTREHGGSRESGITTVDRRRAIHIARDQDSSTTQVQDQYTVFRRRSGHALCWPADGRGGIARVSATRRDAGCPTPAPAAAAAAAAIE